MRKVLVIVAALSLILLAACASVPQEQINAAKAAMDKAKAAGAEMYAPESLKAVTDKEAALNAELANQEGSLFKSYDLTAKLAQEMLDLATKAESDAVAGKEKAMTEANDAVIAAEAAVTAAREALTKAPKGKGSAADLAAMTGDVDAAAKTIEDAKADVTAEKYLDAKTKAEAAKAQAEKVTADVQAAIDLKKGKK